MRSSFRTCIFLALHALNASANADIPPNWPTVIDTAWQHLPEARAAEAREQIVAARQEIAESWLPAAPTLTLGERSDRFNRNAGAREYEAELGLPLWLPGQKDAFRQAADSDAGELRATLLALRLKLAGELRELAWSVRLAEAAQAQAQARFDTARRLEADVARRVQTGDLARVDLNLARTERATAEGDAAQAGLVLGELQRRWKVLSGMSSLPEPLLEMHAPDKHVEEHPRLRKQLAMVDAARTELAARRESKRDAPELAIRGWRERGARAEGYVNSIGFALKIPFATDTRNAPLLAEANGRLIGAEAELAAARRQLTADIQQQRAALSVARQRLTLAEEARQAAVDNLRLYEKSFSFGELDLATLLRARAAAYSSEHAALTAAAEHGRSVARLNQNLGVLP